MTTTVTQQDVLLALLALDAYSRGENAQILDENENHLGTTIGAATFNVVSDDMPADGAAAVDVGFSASKYTLATADGNKTIISYRGTRFDGALGPDMSAVLNGWSLSLV